MRTWQTVWAGLVLAAVVLFVLATTSCGPIQTGQQARNYYIAADEMAWNYAPAGTNMFTGTPFDDETKKFVQAAPDRPIRNVFITPTPTRPHWHGNTVTANGMRTDTVNLLPASMITANMVPDDPGMWGFHCHVSDHILAGMLARYEVLPAQSR